MLAGVGYGVLFLAFAVAVVAFVAALVRGVLATAGVTLVALLGLATFGNVTGTGRWLPTTLLGALAGLVDGTRTGQLHDAYRHVPFERQRLTAQHQRGRDGLHPGRGSDVDRVGAGADHRPRCRVALQRHRGDRPGQWSRDVRDHRSEVHRRDSRADPVERSDRRVDHAGDVGEKVARRGSGAGHIDRRADRRGELQPLVECGDVSVEGVHLPCRAELLQRGIQLGQQCGTARARAVVGDEPAEVAEVGHQGTGDELEQPAVPLLQLRRAHGGYGDAEHDDLVEQERKHVHAEQQRRAGEADVVAGDQAGPQHRESGRTISWVQRPPARRRTARRSEQKDPYPPASRMVGCTA
jgi:hypothetical protein